MVNALTQDDLNPMLRQAAVAFQAAAKAIGSNDQKIFDDQLQSLSDMMQKIVDGLNSITSPMSLESLPRFVSAYTALENGLLDYTRQVKVYRTVYPEMEETAVGKYNLSAIIFRFEKKEFALIPDNAPCEYIDDISVATNNAGIALHDVMNSNYTIPSPPDCVVTQVDSVLGSSSLTSLIQSEYAIPTTNNSKASSSVRSIRANSTQIGALHTPGNDTQPERSGLNLYVNGNCSTTTVSNAIYLNSSIIMDSMSRPTGYSNVSRSMQSPGLTTAPNSAEPQSTTVLTSALTIFCPKPTTICFGSVRCFTVTSSTTLTITDCPCTISIPTESSSIIEVGPGRSFVNVSVPQNESTPVVGPTAIPSGGTVTHESKTQRSGIFVETTWDLQSGGTIKDTSVLRSEATGSTSVPTTDVDNPTNEAGIAVVPTPVSQVSVSMIPLSTQEYGVGLIPTTNTLLLANEGSKLSSILAFAIIALFT